MARFSEQNARCKNCGARWKRHEEKETDVHFSLTFLEDAIDDVFDRAIIISADSDHVPAVRRVRSRLPTKQVFAATPPGRHSMARGLLKVCNSGINITQGRIARCLLPQIVTDLKGNEVARRPSSYDPPPGWTPPLPAPGLRDFDRRKLATALAVRGSALPNGASAYRRAVPNP